MGRVNSGETVQGGDEEARILHQDVPSKIPNGVQLHVHHLFERVDLRLREGSAAPPRPDAERSKEVPHLSELSGVGAHEGYVGHAYQGYSL